MGSRHRDGGAHLALLFLALVAGLASLQTGAQPGAAVTYQAPARAEVVHEEDSEFNRRVFVVDRDGFRSMRFGDLHGEDQSRIRPGHPEQLPMP